MIIFKIKELMKEKAERDGHKITLQAVADATGVNRTSLSKMTIPEYGHSTSTTTIDSLCAYFECDVGDLMTYLPGKVEEKKVSKKKPKKTKEQKPVAE